MRAADWTHAMCDDEGWFTYGYPPCNPQAQILPLENEKKKVKYYNFQTLLVN
jgi:hypothetical protein